MRNRKNDGEDLENTDGRVADASSSPMILTEREIMAEINQTSIPKVAGPMPSEDSKRDEVKLRRLLGTTARRLAAVRGPICSDYDTVRNGSIRPRMPTPYRAWDAGRDPASGIVENLRTGWRLGQGSGRCGIGQRSLRPSQPALQGGMRMNPRTPQTRICGCELIASLPRGMERRFRLRYLPVYPMVQPSVELERGFAFVSFALAKEFSSVLKLSGSGRRLFVLADERQQLR